MKKLSITPTVSVGDLRFSEGRTKVRDQIGSTYKEMKKSVFSKNTMDAYEAFHVYYEKDNTLEAIEFFEGNELTLNGELLFPGTINNAKTLIPDLEEDDDGYISKGMSIGITPSSDDPSIIDGVLVARSGYYSDD